MRVTKEVVISAAHRLLDYSGPCQYLHGHNYRVIVELDGWIDEPEGMVADFRRIVKIVNYYDHKVILWRIDPLIEVLEGCGQRVVISLHNPTVENLACMMGEELSLALGDNIQGIKLRVYETPTAWVDVVSKKDFQ